MRHEARLNERQKDGATLRDYLEARAPRSAAARAALEGPECPEELLYLLRWGHALYGRSGVSEVGVAPLGYVTLESWARQMDVCPAPQPHEVEALMLIDAALRQPGAEEPPDDG